MCIKIKHILYIGFVLLFVSSIAFAGSGDAVWIEGTVTRVPEHINGSLYIQINGDLFRIMPDISIVKRVERNRGAYDENPASINSIFTNQKILMKVKYQDIYQITIL